MKVKVLFVEENSADVTMVEVETSSFYYAFAKVGAEMDMLINGKPWTKAIIDDGETVLEVKKVA